MEGNCKSEYLPVIELRENFEWWYSRSKGVPVTILVKLRDKEAYSGPEGDIITMAWEAWEAARLVLDKDIR